MSAPASVITAAIDSAFNAILLEAFLCGLYTLLFAYTLHTLLRKDNKKAYATVLTCLWVLVMLTFAFDWQFHRTAFVINNDSPLDIAITVVDGATVRSLSILDNVFSVSCNWLADALLIWRCYILWEHKRWVLIPLPILLTAGVVIGLLFTVSRFATPIEQDNFIFLSTFFAISTAITFIGTSLIILRILLVTRSSSLTTHTSAYRKVQRILVESGILYTIATFITTVTLGIPFTVHKTESIPLGNLTTYTEAILVPLSGICQTLIAVRVSSEAPLTTDARASRTWSHSRALSHLTFKRTVPRNSTFNVEDRVSGQRNTPTNSTVGREGYEGDIAKMPVHISDVTP